MQLKYKDEAHRSPCAISCVLDLLGDKWTLLIIRDAIVLGKSSFNEFRKSHEGIASNILSDRLDKLVSYGIMTRSTNSEKRSKIDYELTEKGRQLEPVLMAISKWGSDHIKGTKDLEVALSKLNEKA